MTELDPRLAPAAARRRPKPPTGDEAITEILAALEVLDHRLKAIERRVAAVERRLEPLDGVPGAIDDLRERLGAALADIGARLGDADHHRRWWGGRT